MDRHSKDNNGKSNRGGYIMSDYNIPVSGGVNGLNVPLHGHIAVYNKEFPVIPNPEGEVTGYVTKLGFTPEILQVKDPEVHDWARAEEKPTYTKAEVGLGNVDNTSDLNKPISTATQTALDGKVDKVPGKALSTNDYTDTDKAIVDGVTSALATKVDKIAGKGLSSNDYTDYEKTKLAYIQSGAEVNVQGDWLESNRWSDAFILNKPTKLSDFSNDTGFITSTVDNLTYYYKKSETYTQAEVNALIGSIVTISFLVVQTLPQTGEANIIYLVPADEPNPDNIYEEYIYVNDNWEMIGTTKVDLSNYYTKTETDTLLNGKVDKDGNKVLSDNNYSDTDKTKLDNIYKPYATSVSALTNSYLKDNAVETDIAAYSSKILYIRGGSTTSTYYGTKKDTLTPAKYWLVEIVDVKNNSGYELNRHFVRSSDILSSNGLVLDSNVYTYNSAGEPALQNIASFTDKIPNNTTITKTYVSYVDLSGYSAAQLTNITWRFGLGSFKVTDNSSAITSGIKGILKEVYLFVDDGLYTLNDIYNYIGKNIMSEDIVVARAKEADSSDYTDNICGAWAGKKIITYGDSITSNGGWQNYIEKHFDCTVINKGIGGTSVTDNGTQSPFCSPTRVATLDADADAVIIMGGSNDWVQNRNIGDLTYNDGWNENEFMGALASTLYQIQNRCPNAILFVASPLGGRLQTAGVNQPMPTENNNGLTLCDFTKASKEVADEFGIAYIPINEASGINVWNGATYLADVVHPNDLGKAKIAATMISALEHTRPLE